MNNGWDNVIRYHKKLHEDAFNKYITNPKLCKNCGNVIPYEKRANNYCSSSCFASANNKGVCRNSQYYDNLRRLGIFKSKKIQHRHTKSEQSAKPKTNCLFCGKKIYYRNQYCSDKCKSLYLTQQLLKSGKATKNNKRAIKNYLSHIRGRKCEVCKLEKWIIDNKTHPIPIELHHKDGDVKNMDVNNLLLICPNCHSFTDTFKSKNRNKTNTNRKSYQKKKDT